MKTILDYTIYCTEEQTRKALKLGAPIETTSKEPSMFFYAAHPKTFISEGVKNANKEFTCAIPTTEQMIGFLRSRGMRFYFNDITALWQVVYNSKIIGQGCSFNKELYAIDAALEYLMNNKK